MSKAKKEFKIPSRLRVAKKDLSLPKLFDMISLVSFLVAVLFAGLTYFIKEKMDSYTPWVGRWLFWNTWIRSSFSVMMYALVTFGLSYATARLMMDQEQDQIRHFKNWFIGEVVLVVLIILGLGLFY